MKIQNTTAKLLTVPAGPNRPALLLPPGISTVPDDVIDQILEEERNSVFHRWLTSGRLAAVADEETLRRMRETGDLPPASPAAPEGSTGNADATDLAQFNAEEAGELIDAETDAGTLRAWLEAEKRKGVRGVLEARLAQVEGE